MVEQATDLISPASEWLRDIMSDRKKYVAIKRASTLDQFKSSWYVAALLGQLHLNKSDQLLAALWGCSTAKDICSGSLAAQAQKHGIHERHWQKLTSTLDREEAARQVRRIVRQLPAAPVDDVIEKLFYWGPSARRRWAMAWFDLQEEEDDAS